MRWLALAALLAACGHADGALREEQAKSRSYRDAYETEAQEVARLKARLATLERTCQKSQKSGDTIRISP